MAGKSVNRARAQAFKFRFQQTARSSNVTDRRAPDRAAQAPTVGVPTVLAVKPGKGENGDRAHSQAESKAVNPLRRSRVPGKVTRGLRLLAAPLIWLCLLAFCGGTGVAAFLWLTTLPPVANCQKLIPASADTDKLYCAEQAARSGKVEALLAGLALVKNWSADHPLHIRANRAVKEWSKALLTIARTKADRGDLAGAIALAKKIPANSSIHAEVQTALLDWQKGANRGQAIEAVIQTAFQQQDWQTATEKLQALVGLDDQYAQQNISRLRQQLVTERAARQQLQQARQVAESAPGNVTIIGRAIALAEQIDARTYAHVDAQNDMQAWGQLLLNRLTEQLGQSDLPGAIATAGALPLSLPLPSVARDLVWVSRAQPLAANRLLTRSPDEQFRQLWVALAQVKQIRADSPLYSQTKPLLLRLEQQSQDLLQIQMATSVARLKQMPTLQAAIALMQTLTPDHPQRLYAQTLIAQWRKEIQQLEDQPYLAQARQLAATGTIPKLKAAIAQAQQIAPGRALRLEAQSAIAKWTRQIQTIEDQPLLTQAQAFAKAKKLKEAIQSATKIRAGRALYKETQVLINNWTAQLQLAEDQPLLDEARALADRGSLSDAINLASKIGAGRALYGEAQQAIARWSAQRSERLRPRRSFPGYEAPSVPEPYRPTPEPYNEPPVSTPSLPPELPPP
ncbi:hypothetical protein [Stenomitos frigidus]|uniref:Chromosome segregation ATPase n=1 Tax=Stenomitos frigidus ULC18 TaxID=2107698 RepID=A0A2T1E1S8_9CYAN|nr:hypothetical protein [Stenomitos frigidus]PSB26677.1 hypothetical protein C7B82_18930 [Stenomitos frigidus ULC18]